MTAIIKPTIHINGTPAERLRDDNETATRALSSAIESLQDAAPNGRDYYPQGPEAASRAQREHHERVAALRSVYVELVEIGASIERDIDARDSQRAGVR